MRLLPREEKFFEYFLSQVSLISEASGTLLAGARQGNSNLAEAAMKIKQLERKGDEIIHDIFTRLNQTFITPLDPEDIHSLASHLDDVLDGIEDAVHRIVSYKLEPIPATVVELCEIVDACARQLEVAFKALSTHGTILQSCIEINRLEDKADTIFRRVLPELFEKEKDPIRLIKLKEVHEFLEATTDRCEDVADALQNVVVKNS